MGSKLMMYVWLYAGAFLGGMISDALGFGFFSLGWIALNLIGSGLGIYIWFNYFRQS